MLPQVERPELQPANLVYTLHWKIDRPASTLTELSLQYPQPPDLLSLIGYVSKIKAEEDIKIASGEIIPLEERIISLAGGLPPFERLNRLWNDYYAHAQEELKERGVSAIEALQYTGAAGNERIRVWAAKEMEKLTGQQVTKDEILTVPGLQYGISETILKLCAREKKVILTQTPTYSAFLEAAEDPIDVPVFAVESDNQGMIPESLEATIVKLLQEDIDPGLVYGMAIGNPDGSIMSDERGKQLNEICKKYDIPFFIDYAYYKLKLPFNPQPEPRITYLDDNIILGFTTAKMATPGKRNAWMVIKGEKLRKKLVKTKQAQLIMTPPSNELEFWQLAERPDFDDGITKVRAAYAVGIDTGLQAVAENSDIFQIDAKPGGGMFLYAKVPEGISTYKYLGEILAKYKIAYSPGIWSQPRQLKLPTGEVIGPPLKDNYMRLCVVTESPETVTRAINKLAQAFREIAEREGVAHFQTLTNPAPSVGEDSGIIYTN